MVTTTGVVVGKFLPFHRGHRHLVETAAAGCDELFVLSFGSTGEEAVIPLAVRVDWLRELVGGSRVHVRAVIDDAPTSNTDPAIISHWCEAILALIERPSVDVLFTSEAATYGDVTAAGIGARHVCVDPGRVAFPVSGTAVRANPYANWAFLDEPVRAWYAKRVRVLGGESTGTTTLADLLARRYATAWVPEWGRAYSDRLDFGGLAWSTADFGSIARRQAALEEVRARRSNRVLVCDTDPLTTGIWHEVYLGSRSAEVEAVGAGRRYDLTFVTDTDIPWAQDGNRRSAEARSAQQRALIGRLDETGSPYVVISGSRSERLAQATALVAALGIPAPDDGVALADDGLADRWRWLSVGAAPTPVAAPGWSAARVAGELDARGCGYEALAADLGVPVAAVREADWFAARFVELADAEVRGDGAAIARLATAAQPATAARLAEDVA